MSNEHDGTTWSTEPRVWEFRLYVAGQTPKSQRAVENLRQLCDQHLAGRHTIEVIDLYKDPRLAREDQIVALPTLVRKLPVPLRRVVGDLSNVEKTLIALELRSTAPP